MILRPRSIYTIYKCLYKAKEYTFSVQTKNSWQQSSSILWLTKNLPQERFFHCSQHSKMLYRSHLEEHTVGRDCHCGDSVNEINTTVQ